MAEMSLENFIHGQIEVKRKLILPEISFFAAWQSPTDARCQYSLVVTLCLASGAVYCNRSCLCVCLWRAGGRCLQRVDGVCGGPAGGRCLLPR